MLSPFQKFRITHAVGVAFQFGLVLVLQGLDGFVSSEYGEVKDGTHYLSRAGLFWSMWTRLGMLYLARNMLLFNAPNLLMTSAQFKKLKFFGAASASDSMLVKLLYFYQIDPLEENLFPALSTFGDRLNGVSDDSIRDVLTSGDSTRVAKLAVMCGQVILNCAFMYLNLTSLPERDPFEALNQAKHYVTYFECTVMAFLILQVVATSVHSLLLGFKGAAAVFATRVKAVAGWSAFHLLRYANPTFAMTWFDNKRSSVRETYSPDNSTAIATFSTFVVTLVGGGLGIMAMAVKVSQLGFVHEKTVWDYHIPEAIKLAGFTLNIVSIFDLGDITKHAVHRFLVQDKEHGLLSDPFPIWLAWEQHLSERILKTFGSGFKSFIIMATLSADDIRRLLIEQEQQPPALLRKALTVDETILDKIPAAEQVIVKDAIMSRIALWNESRGSNTTLDTPLLATV
mmetsp:Transcript_116067/g.223873  ORF Transcript_116067/g.223873 Transcript_116067/m.223873 type:complete len:455 (+) Transcript_116067:113-1477(+)